MLHNIFPISRFIVGKLYHSLIFIKRQITSYNHTAHEILTKEISLILPNFPNDKKDKRSIIASLITGFIGLAYKGIFLAICITKDKKPYTKHSWLWRIK